MDSNEQNYEDQKIELQSMWKIPCIAQFVSLFRFIFKLPEIEIEELEDGILQHGKVACKILEELILAFLKGFGFAKGVNGENWEFYLEKASNKGWLWIEGSENPLQNKTFQDLHISSKVDVLYFLCYFRLHYTDVSEEMKNMDAEALRVQPLGSDDLGNEYWYFYGTRLYKQEPAKEVKKKDWEQEWDQQKKKSFIKRGRGRPRKDKLRKSDGESEDYEYADPSNNSSGMNINEKSRWSVVCNSIEDWVNFAEKLKNSKSKNEKALFITVKDNFLPVLNDIYQEKERKLQQKLQELIPRNKIITRTLTRKGNRKSSSDHDENNEDSVRKERKQHLIRDRARRLEERNRRSDEFVSSSRSRSRSRLRYDDSDSGTDDSEEENMDTTENVSGYCPDNDDYIKNFLPQINNGSQDLKSMLIRLISEVKITKDAWPFLLPVDESIAPGYYEIIKDPIDLSTITCKLFENRYKTIHDMDDDFRKMVSNCRLYNGEESEVSKKAVNLWRMFRKGMAKISNSSDIRNKYMPAANTNDSFSQKEEQNAEKYCTSVNSSKPQRSVPQRTSHKEALEALSRESEIAVENVFKDVQDTTNLQQKSYGGFYSDLKIVPIHSHPQSMIDKFSSDSSNQDPDSCHEDSIFYSSSPVPEPNAIDEDNFNEDSSELTELIGKEDPKGFNILSDGEGSNNILSDNGEEPTEHKSEDLDKQPDEDLAHGITNILEEECDNNVSTVMPALDHEQLYSKDDALSSDKESRSSTSSTPLSPDSCNKSSQDLETDFNRPSVLERNVPLLQESLSIHPEFNGFSNTSDVSTVDASVLGISESNIHYAKLNESTLVSSPPNQASVSHSAEIINKSSFQSYHAALRPNEESAKSRISSHPFSPLQTPTFNMSTGDARHVFGSGSDYLSSFKTVSPTTSVRSPLRNSIRSLSSEEPTALSPEVPVQVSTSFPNVITHQNLEPHKFPELKLRLPPSSGNIVVIPGTPDSSTMTFHLYSQSKENPSQAYESNAIIHADGSVQQLEEGSKESQDMQNTVDSVKQAAEFKESVICSPKQVANLGNKTHSESVSPLFSQVPFTTLQSTLTNNRANLPAMSAMPLVPDTNCTFSSFQNIPTSVIKPNISVLKPSAFSTNSNSFGTRLIDATGENGSLLQSLAAKTVPSILPYYSQQTNAVVPPKGPHSVMSMPKMFIPNNVPQFHPQFMQNGGGPYIFMMPQDTSKRISNAQKLQSADFAKIIPESSSGPSVFHSANPTMIQSFSFPTSQMNPSHMYTQVAPNQIPQFVNIPQYMVADQNMLHSSMPMRHPIVNSQPVTFLNRSSVPIDLGNR